MKKGAFLVVCLLLASAICGITCFDEKMGQASGDHSTEDRTILSFEEPVIRNIEEHTIITIPDTTPWASHQGAPMVPARTVNILLPPDASGISSVDITPISESYLGSSLRLMPRLPDTNTHGGEEAAMQNVDFHAFEDSEIYDSYDFYPDGLHSLPSKPHVYRGYRIIPLTVFPIRYIPKTGEAWFISEMRIDVAFDNSQNAPEARSKFYRGTRADMEEVQAMVFNPEAAELYVVNENNLGVSPYDAPLSPPYKLVIITDSSFAANFQPLVEWKSSVWITTGVVTLQDIQANYTGMDLQEKIRNFVTYAYGNWGTEYILLGGDVDVIPHRGFYGYVSTFTGPVEDFDIPADIYYGALDGTWDGDGDGIWGEDGEEDLFAEVYVGRAPVSVPFEVEYFVEKTISYESRAEGNDYLSEVLFVGEQLDEIPTWGGDYLDDVETMFSPAYNIMKLYERDTTYDDADVISEINNGKHIINNNGHGNTMYVGTLYNGDVRDLVNTKYHLWYSISCYSASYDNRWSGGFYGDDAIAEKMVEKSGGGAVSFIGNSRYGWYYPGTVGGAGHDFNMEFFNLAFNQGLINIGKTLQKSKESMSPWVLATGSYRWTYFTLNLLGDPTLKIGGYAPSPPLDLQADPGDSMVELTWSTPLNDGGFPITNYNIYRGTSSGQETYLTMVGDVLGYNDLSVTNGVTYYYRVSAVNFEGDGVLSNEASATPGVPFAPQDLEAVPGDSEVFLTWNPPADNGGFIITNYSIYRGTTSGGEAYLTTIGNVLNYNDMGLTNGVTYYYRVSAVNEFSEGPLSNEASATPGTPEPPQDAQAVSGSDYINLTWSPPLYDGGFPITGYVIYRGTESGVLSYYAGVGDILYFNDTSVVPEQPYFYTVSAVNALFEGPQSNEATAIPSAPIWPMFMREPAHTALSPFDTSENDLTMKWNFLTGDEVASSPVIGKNGTVYFGSDKAYAVSRDGELLWTYTLPDVIGFSSPAIGPDGTIYFGNREKNLYAFNPDGSLKWIFPTNKAIWSSLAVGRDGTVYFGAQNNRIYAVNPDGTQKWYHRTSDIVRSTPAIGPDGTIYVGTSDQHLYAFNPDGSVRWVYDSPSYIWSSPAVGDDGSIYFLSNNNLIALDQDGSFQWEYTMGYSPYPSPAIGSDGTIYIGGGGGGDGSIFAIRSDGALKWRYYFGTTAFSSPAIGADGTIYAGGANSLLALNPDGTLKHSFETGDTIWSSPAIDQDGTVYIGSDDYRLYALTSSLLLGSVKNIDTMEHFGSIQAAIDDSDTVNGHTITVANGTYYEDIIVNKQLTLIGESHNTTIINGSGSSDAVYISSDWVNISGFTITGSGPSTTDSGVEIHLAQNVFIHDNILKDNVRSGIRLNLASNNTVSDNNLFNNYYGIYLYSSDYNIVRGNNASNNDDIGIYLTFSSHNDITNNIASSNAWNGIYLYYFSHSNVISGNTANSNADSGIWIHRESNNNLIENNIANNNYYGIPVEGYLYNGVDEYYSTGNIVRGNTVVGNWNVGIYLYLAISTTVSENVVTENKIRGIQDGWGDSNTINNNHVTLNTQFGFRILYTNNAMIFNNTASGSTEAVYLFESNQNTIAGNIITDSTWGFNLESSRGNSIYGNYIMDNIIQAQDDGSDNLWNASYPVGGNYWSDLPGPCDAFTGSDQDIPGSDGINDTAYIIDIDSQDYYPLMLSGGHISLQPGLNHFSLPRVQGDTAIAAVLASIDGKYDKVMAYEPADVEDPWKEWTTYKSSWMTDLSDIDHSMGLIVNIIDPAGAILLPPGEAPTDENNNIDIYTGWNFVGFPSLTDKDRDAGLNNLTIGVEIGGAYRFNATSDEWEEMTASDMFKVGESYWVYALTDCLWDVPL